MWVLHLFSRSDSGRLDLLLWKPRVALTVPLIYEQQSLPGDGGALSVDAGETHLQTMFLWVSVSPGSIIYLKWNNEQRGGV